MSITKIRVSRCLRLVPSDTIPIPKISSLVVSGSASATTASKLVDSTKDFITLGVKVGNIIYNTTDFTAATVTAVDSATTLSISADIIVSTEGYTIYAEASEGGVFMVGQHGGGSTGSIKILTMGNDTVTIDGVTSGQVIPIDIKKVFSTGTTVLSVYAMW